LGVGLDKGQEVMFEQSGDAGAFLHYHFESAGRPDPKG